MLNKDALIEQAKRQLDNLSAELDELEVKAQEMGGEAKKIYDEKSGDLRALVEEAWEKFEQAKSVGEESWSQLKDQVELTQKALRNSFNYFKSHFK
jgi:hypothetical protein